MFNFIQKFHSGWAYLALALLLFAVINALMGKSSGREFTARDRKIGLFALIASHIQLVVGLVLYFGFQKEMRLSSMEHPIATIIAIILITIGWSKHKKTEASDAKFKSFLIFYSLGLLFIFSCIPWHLWL
jgi:NADH:ubiquinone oxidoreductase subunit 2 (subunit N)